MPTTLALRPSPRGARRRETGRSYGRPVPAWSRRRCPRPALRPGSDPGRTSRSEGCTTHGPPPGARTVPRRRGRRRPGHSRSDPQFRCIGAGTRRCGCPSSGRRSRRLRGLLGRRAAALVRSRERRHAPRRRPRRPCTAGAACRGLASPAHSAIVQQFFRGRSDSSPSTNRPARRRGSYRANRPAIQPMVTSNASRHRAGGTVSSFVHTTHDDQRWPHPSPHRPPPVVEHP